MSPYSGRLRSRFLAVGDYENTVRILSLDHEDVFSSLAVQALPAPPESLCIVRMKSGTDSSSGTLFLNIGLNNGVLQRTVIDRVTGELSDTRTRFYSPSVWFYIQLNNNFFKGSWDRVLCGYSRFELAISLRCLPLQADRGYATIINFTFILLHFPMRHWTMLLVSRRSVAQKAW